MAESFKVELEKMVCKQKFQDPDGELSPSLSDQSSVHSIDQSVSANTKSLKDFSKEFVSANGNSSKDFSVQTQSVQRATIENGFLEHS